MGPQLQSAVFSDGFRQTRYINSKHSECGRLLTCFIPIYVMTYWTCNGTLLSWHLTDNWFMLALTIKRRLPLKNVRWNFLYVTLVCVAVFRYFLCVWRYSRYAKIEFVDWFRTSTHLKLLWQHNQPDVIKQLTAQSPNKISIAYHHCCLHAKCYSLFIMACEHNEGSAEI